VPRRHPGIDPSGILDGANPDAEWLGFHTLDELPQVWNPDTGWLLNTNSTPLTATTGLTWRREDFPAYMIGTETDNARAVSSRRVLASLHSVTFDDFAGRVWDSRLSEADAIVPELLAEWAALPTSETKQALAHAIDRLRDWDRFADTASVETTWFILANERRIAAQRAGEQPTRPRLDGLAHALQSLRTRWGTVDVPWGWLNRHQRPLPGAPAVLDTLRSSLPVGGAPGALGSVFSYDSAPFGSPGPRMGRGGNSFVKVVAFAPTLRAGSILNYGQSGDAASPHFFDQAALYAQRRFKPAWFTRADVVANATRTYSVQ
jgi:acyl-homoserine-lactone acylase